MDQIERLAVGDVLAKDLLHPETSHPLLPSGTVLNETLIRKIRQLHLEEVALAHIYKRILDSSDLLDAPYCGEQIRLIREQLLVAIDCATARTPFDLSLATRSVESLLDAIEQAGDWRGRELRSVGDYDSAHPVNVMLLCLVTGRGMGFSRNQLVNLCLGSLFHDIGRYRLPQGVFNKEGPLTMQEYGIVRQHPMAGVELLQNSWRMGHFQALEVVRCHHERADGSGYPEGLKGSSIPQMAYLAAIADTYDAMLSDRTYRRRISPSLAYQCIRTSSGRLFDAEVAANFLRLVNPYPIGSKVFLNTGEMAEVLQENPNNPLMPLVLLDGQEVNLATDRKGTIVSGCFPRSFRRVNVTGKLDYDAGQANPFQGELCNISGSGVCFLDPQGVLKITGTVRMHIQVDGEDIEATGKVMWTKPQGPGNSLVGILFSRITPENHLKILRLVDSIEPPSWLKEDALFGEKP